ncbi:MAG: BtpA/SgcQ family protein [Erysipelotrichaceae bacterium]|nr:BtpA/SgcQ family protein [Erysipelotrichaceae bacterium]
MWMKELFGTDKPVIGMLHLKALPTDPKYDPVGGVEAVLERAREDLHALQDGGIDGVLFCNEFSIPYVENVRVVTIACMARIIGELKSEIKVPFGVDVAMDPYKAFDLAAAVGASFVRETFFGAYAGDYGISNYPQGEIERHRIDVGCRNVYTLATLVPEGAKQVAERPIEDVARSVTFSIAPSAFMVFGNNAGAEIDTSNITRAKAATDTPVFASNGVKAHTVADMLKISDGCIVGTWLKVDGKFFNKVDKARVEELMANAKAFRGDL